MLLSGPERVLNSQMRERFDFDIGKVGELGESVVVLKVQTSSTVELGPVMSWKRSEI